MKNTNQQLSIFAYEYPKNRKYGFRVLKIFIAQFSKNLNFFYRLHSVYTNRRIKKEKTVFKINCTIEVSGRLSYISLIIKYLFRSPRRHITHWIKLLWADNCFIINTDYSTKSCDIPYYYQGIIHFLKQYNLAPKHIFLYKNSDTTEKLYCLC